jgi:hypothetical protein
MLTRRAAVWLGLGIPAFAASDFWNDKDPSSWSEKEDARLLSNSPWAKETSVALGAARLNGGYSDAGSAGVGRSPAGGMGGGAGSRGSTGGQSAPGDGEMRGQPPVRVLVRWESATPVRQAARKPVPPLASQYYIITVSGLPASGHDPDQDHDISGGLDTRKQMEYQLKEGTELLRKGKDPIYPERLQLVDKEAQRTAVFLFSRTPQPLALEDKEVLFVSGVGSLQFKVRFPLKEMMYHGKLDL